MLLKWAAHNMWYLLSFKFFATFHVALLLFALPHVRLRLFSMIGIFCMLQIKQMHYYFSFISMVYQIEANRARNRLPGLQTFKHDFFPNKRL